MLTQKKYKDNKPELLIRERLSLVRKKLKEFRIDAFLVPHNDMYFNEITAPFHNRLEWITGFTGSAGFAIIFKDSAVIFTDGRYSIQIRQEDDQSFFTIESITRNSPFSWLQKNIKTNNYGLKITLLKLLERYWDENPHNHLFALEDIVRFLL